ncbi:MAG: transcriptional regulator [Alphaproteobacteria bacterium]|nr:transcriptional regulator [Alphaproteobacteria bacterium]HCQ71261.1 transcriptional regulator [Rhodospirillaceae bacterium]|tara:strand:+ start:7924 stop:8370 length:447 start_codon:yes stop_codon:yes gene_type:complete
MADKATVKKTKGLPDKIDVHVGNRLRVRRTLLGLSQEKLAGAIGLTFQQVQKYERGLNRISAGRLYQFSRILDIPVSYFYENINQSNSSNLGLSDNDQDNFHYDGSEDLMENKETIDLLRAYYSIQDTNMRKDILKFIKSMSQKIKND